MGPPPLLRVMTNGYFREDLDPLTSKSFNTLAYKFFSEYKMNLKNLTDLFAKAILLYVGLFLVFPWVLLFGLIQLGVI